MKIKLILIIICCFFGIQAFSQKDNIKIIPLSPNAAEFTRYGEIPVSNFTGIPSIGLPLYTVKSGSLELPLNLSYHAGGNKVEAIASWVGLSWSISGLPTVSRSVNGAPDELALGYMNKIGGKTIRQYAENYQSGYDAQLESLMAKVRDENGDTEPDAFYFSINGKSGKVFYNQEVEHFVSSPYYPDLKFEFGGQFITITDDDGTKYFFGNPEVTSTATTTQGQPVATAWMISQIVSANLRDTISFTYETENVISQSLISEVKNIFIDNAYCNTLPADIQGGQLTSITAKTLASISFKGGYINFTKQAIEREDLRGSYALDQMKVFNHNQELIKQFRFGYKYLTGMGCISNDNYRSNKWMLLTKVEQISIDNGTTLTHTFDYNELIIPACRYSRAQDYWGYYNGETSNTTLVPSTAIPNSPNTIVAGANRSVKPSYTQFAILQKLTYPTGGYTLFTYENNDSNETGIPKTYVTENPYIAQEEPVGEGEELPTYKEYETTFVINNPTDLHLNNNNPNGGAFVSGNIQNLGVSQGSSGASISIQRISPSSPTVITYPTISFQNYYLPNGTYKLKGVFNQNPPNYQEFQVILSFDRLDNLMSDAYVGGLRIKKISSYDGVNSQPLVNNYIYKDTLSSASSSGITFLKPLFRYAYVIPYGTSCLSALFKIRSYSNQAQVTSSGSYVGYRKVFVTADDTNTSGLTSYQYTHVQDQLTDDRWPFPPAQSMEAFRGQLQQQRLYKKTGNGYQVVKSTHMGYTNTLLDSLRLFALKTSSELLIGSSGGTGEMGWPKFAKYETALEWSVLAKQTERLYDEADTTKFNQTLTDFYYAPYRMQVISKTTTDSKGQQIRTNNYYPYQLSLSGTAENARQWLLQHNNKTVTLKEETLVNNVLTAAKMKNYKNFDGQQLVMENELISYNDINDQQKIYKDAYDAYGNLIQFHKANGIFSSYLWGYKGTCPIIEVQNADYTTITAALGNTLIDNLNGPNPSKAMIDATVSVLKANLPNAFITSYTYKPLVGMTSQTDVKGMTTYYEYDAFGRLQYVRDQNNNIVKSNTYHYKN